MVFLHTNSLCSWTQPFDSSHNTLQSWSKNKFYSQSVIGHSMQFLFFQTPALRKRSLISDQSSLAKGLSILVILFCLCWSFAPVAYLNLTGDDTPSFYPGICGVTQRNTNLYLIQIFFLAFQLLNSFMGLFMFLCIGIGSKKFRNAMVQKMKKQQMVMKRINLNLEMHNFYNFQHLN